MCIRDRRGVFHFIFRCAVPEWSSQSFGVINPRSHWKDIFLHQARNRLLRHNTTQPLFSCTLAIFLRPCEKRLRHDIIETETDPSRGPGLCHSWRQLENAFDYYIIWYKSIVTSTSIVENLNLEINCPLDSSLPHQWETSPNKDICVIFLCWIYIIDTDNRFYGVMGVVVRHNLISIKWPFGL